MIVRDLPTLRARIAASGQRHADIAQTAGCTPGFISQLATGTKASCTTRVAAGVAEALATPLDQLFMAPGPSADQQNSPQREGAA